jgi:hypothetical protein
MMPEGWVQWRHASVVSIVNNFTSYASANIPFRVYLISKQQCCVSLLYVDVAPALAKIASLVRHVTHSRKKI